MNMEFRESQLDNGLKIVAEVNPAAVSMAAGFLTRTGSRDETPEVAGVSHFLEHMMFKGTERRSAFDVNREFDDMGAQYNAFTSEENTVYFAAVLPEFRSRAADLLGDILRPSLRQDDFDIEKNVIVDEIARYDDQPGFRVYEKLMAAHFAGHPLGNNILGTPESIHALKRDDMQAYFDRRYSPGNMTVVGVGNLDFEAFEADVAKACADWTPCETDRPLPPAQVAGDEKVLVDGRLAREHVGMMSAAPTSQDPARFAAQLMATIVGDATGSRYYYALIDPAIADEAHMAYDPLDRAGAFFTYLSVGPDRAAEAVSIVRNELRKFMDDGPTEAEMQAAKNKIASAATRKGERPMGRLMAVGFDWVYRHEYVPLTKQIDELFAVTTEQVIDVARTYDLASSTLLALGPAESV